jgi:hypothetical protein
MLMKGLVSPVGFDRGSRSIVNSGCSQKEVFGSRFKFRPGRSFATGESFSKLLWLQVPVR